MEKRKIRIVSMDITRGWAVLFMVAVHVQNIFSREILHSGVIGFLYELTGGPLAAPVFMFLMGVSHGFSKARKDVSSIFRGLRILLLGYLLNLLRLVIPLFLHRLNWGVSFHLDVGSLGLLDLLLIGDILQFAGLALFVLYLVERWEIPSWIIWLAAIIIALVSPFLWGLRLEVPLLGHFMDLLWGGKSLSGLLEQAVNFPLFPWIVFPLGGIILGRLLVKASEPQKLIHKLWLPGLLIAIPGAVLLFLDFEGQFNNYYNCKIGALLFMLSLTVLWLWLWNLLSESIPLKLGLLQFFSRNVTSIYMVHWVLIAFVGFFLPMQSLGGAGTLVFTILLVGVSSAFALLLSKGNKPLDSGTQKSRKS